MINELFVLNTGGQVIYSWHHDEQQEDSKDELVGGFLSALNSFATMERGEDIKSLKLKETQIIFERFEELEQHLTFVATTKSEELIELIHSIIHKIMDTFTAKYEERLDRPFDGDITPFKKFDENINEIFMAYGLDVLESTIEKIDAGNSLKSVLFLEPGDGDILFIHAKQYVDKDKMSYLIPLLTKSSKLLYERNLNQQLNWIMFNTIKNEILLIEIRVSIFLVKTYDLKATSANTKQKLEIFDESHVSTKKLKKLEKQFSDITYSENILQFFVVNLEGSILFKHLQTNESEYENNIPEIISFLTSSKRASQEIFNRNLLSCSIGGVSTVIFCVNLNNVALIVIGNRRDLESFEIIEEVYMDILAQLKSI
jgi:hypothetical protein